jgi:hypothetical protein
VRSGSIGGWQGRLTHQHLELIEMHAGKTLTRLGYPSMAEAELELAHSV